MLGLHPVIKAFPAPAIALPAMNLAVAASPSAATVNSVYPSTFHASCELILNPMPSAGISAFVLKERV